MNRSSRLCEPLAHAPLVLHEQYAPKLREGVGWVIECSEDALPVLDGQSDDQHVRLERVLEHGCGRLVHEGGKLTDGVLADRYAGEHHRDEAIS